MDDVKIDAERDPFRKEGVKAREEDKIRQKKQALALKAGRPRGYLADIVRHGNLPQLLR